jgi:hypothetical protein
MPTSIRCTLAVCLLALAACISQPYDGEVVANHPTTIIPHVSGWILDPSTQVQIQARNSGGTFVQVATATSAASGWVWDGDTWFSWNIDNLNLPSTYWTDKPFGCGQRATLRVAVGANFAVSLDQPWSECWDYDQDLSDFLDACMSDDSPTVTIETCGALCC